MAKKNKAAKKTGKTKKEIELNLLAKTNQKFKNFFEKRNNSKMVYVRPR